MDWVKSVPTFVVPPPPAWLADLAFFGGDLAAAWEKVAVAGIQDFLRKLAPHGGKAIGWFATEVGGFGFLLLQFLLPVGLAAILYARGEMAAAWVHHRFGRRLAGFNHGQKD